MKRVLIILALICGLAACNKQPTIPSSSAPTKTIQTMVWGIDQFETENAWGLNTGHGPFVIGPEVDASTKSMLHETIMEARNYVITIRYVDMPAQGSRVAHRRVLSMVIHDKEIILVK